MTKWAVSMLLAGMLLGVAGAADPAEAWVCRAKSKSAWGEGYHSHLLAYAKQRALLECAARTPKYQTCWIVACR